MTALLVALALCVPPAGTPAAPAAPPAPSAPAGTAPPAAPAPAPVPAVHPLDPAVFAHSVDGLSDLKPVTRVVARMSRRITAVTVDPGAPSELFTVRPGAGTVQFLSAERKDHPVVLGAFRWDGPTLEWSWNRCSTAAHGKAIAALAAALPGGALAVELEGGAVERVCAPPAQLRVTLDPSASQRVRIPAPVGRAMTFVVASDPVWESSTDPATPSAVTLSSKAGDVVLSWDPATAECAVEWVSSGMLELQEARKELVDRKKEAAQRAPDERRIVEQEIAELERRIAQMAEEAKHRELPSGKLPTVTVKGPDGRVHAVLELAIRQKATK